MIIITTILSVLHHTLTSSQKNHTSVVMQKADRLQDVFSDIDTQIGTQTDGSLITIFHLCLFDFKLFGIYSLKSGVIDTLPNKSHTRTKQNE